MPQHAAQQRSHGAAEASPGAPGVRSIRQEAAALRAAQAAGTQIRPMGSPAELDLFFAQKQAQRLKEAEERWGITMSVNGEPVPVPGHDWEWQIEAQASGRNAATSRQGHAAAPTTTTGHAALCSIAPNEVPPAPVKRVEKRRGAPPDSAKAPQSCGAQTRQARRLLADVDLMPPSLKAFFPAR